MDFSIDCSQLFDKRDNIILAKQTQSLKKKKKYNNTAIETELVFKRVDTYVTRMCVSR